MLANSSSLMILFALLLVGDMYLGIFLVLLDGERRYSMDGDLPLNVVMDLVMFTRLFALVPKSTGLPRYAPGPGLFSRLISDLKMPLVIRPPLTRCFVTVSAF